MREPTGPSPRRQPLFLARQNYRRRRVMDAARLLPVLAGFLFLMPALWGGGGQGRRPTASDGIYLILAWGALILMAFLISRALGDEARADAPDADLTPRGGDGTE